jgi:hypothetical protein
MRGMCGYVRLCGVCFVRAKNIDIESVVWGESV